MSVMEKKLFATVQHPVMKQYNKTISFCSDARSIDMMQPGILHVEVIDCPNISDCSGTFISRLSYNASRSPGTIIQIGSSSAVNDSTCSPGDPSDAESVNNSTLLVINCTGISYYYQ